MFKKNVKKNVFLPLQEVTKKNIEGNQIYK